MNFALKFVDTFYQFVSLNETVVVTNRFDSIYITSSGSGSKPSAHTLYLHLDPYFRVMTTSKLTFRGFIGLKLNSTSNASFAWFNLSFFKSTANVFSINFWYIDGTFSSANEYWLFSLKFSIPSNSIWANDEIDCLHCVDSDAIFIPLLISVTPTIGKVQNIFYDIMTIYHLRLSTRQ